jgi:hypothetical protein
VVIALVLGFTIGAAFVFGTPVLGVAILAPAIGAFALFEFSRRRQRSTDMKKFREEAGATKTEFTARDRETQVEDHV